MAVIVLYGSHLLWLAFHSLSSDRLLPGTVSHHLNQHGLSGWRPTVTVQIPLYNETSVAERVIDACAHLEYPSHLLDIQVLDDSTDETTDLAENAASRWSTRGVPISVIHRQSRDGFKAGALQNGLGTSKSELIAVFDADFVPGPDFLLRLLHHFESAAVGCVQARWTHMNDRNSILTRAQAAGLDAHFAVEQAVRYREGVFINFNGTAGIWRRSCIEDAGGWSGDTLAEDLDLSFRAQMRGWKLVYDPSVTAPAELPSTMGALRAQQFRWTKGGAQTAKKLLRSFWRADVSARTRRAGTLHLLSHLVYPCILILTLTHAPLALQRSFEAGPGDLYFAFMALGLIALAGFFLVQLSAQRILHPDWPRRLMDFPWFAAGSLGLAINNTRAVIEGWAGVPSGFVRTPKGRKRKKSKRRRRSGSRRFPKVVWIESFFMLWSIAGFGVVVWFHEWAAAPFQLLFAAGFGLVSVAGFRDAAENPGAS